MELSGSGEPMGAGPRRDVDPFLGAVAAWAREEPGLMAVALVGSYARGTAGADSDVDLVLLSERPDALLGDRRWVQRFGRVVREAVEGWGTLTSLRVWYEGGLEVEFGITGVDWALGPADDGDTRVVAGGIEILYDRDGELGRRAARIAARAGVEGSRVFIDAGGQLGADREGTRARKPGSSRRVRVVPYDPAWPAAFAAEAAGVAEALSALAPRIHHIGSTAVPGLAAKPIIDLLAEVEDIDALDGHLRQMEGLGYVAMGEFGIPGRRFFRKHDGAGERTHHVHAFAARAGDVARHLAFRDYMRCHSEAARAYGELKLRLSREHPEDIEAYMAGKDAFVKEHEAKALAWWPGASGGVGHVTAPFTITPFAIRDYDEAIALWRRSEGIGLSGADERLDIAAYLERNPGVSFAARVGGTLAGAVLGGHDGRRGYIYHLAVDAGFRHQGIGAALMEASLGALRIAGIQKCHVFVYADNEAGIGFWRRRGWEFRTELAVMSMDLVP